MKEKKDGFRYYVHDGSAFRGPSDWKLGVSHIWGDKKWEPYKGHGGEPAVYGRPVSLEEAMRY